MHDLRKNQKQLKIQGGVKIVRVRITIKQK